jgi:hypothetical protein
MTQDFALYAVIVADHQSDVFLLGPVVRPPHILIIMLGSWANAIDPLRCLAPP